MLGLRDLRTTAKPHSRHVCLKCTGWPEWILGAPVRGNYDVEKSMRNAYVDNGLRKVHLDGLVVSCWKMLG